MTVCWFCFWGWPKPIQDIYNVAVQELQGNNTALLYGPAHIVWSDENFDSAQWCLDHFEDSTGGFTEWELNVVRESLEKLVAVPDKYKNWPTDYDGQHPENFPPDWD